MSKLSSKQRSQLMGMASSIGPMFQIGKSGLTPEYTQAVREALEARELVKINVLRSCAEDKRELADTLAGRTGSEVVTVIGQKIVLFRYQKDPDKRKIDI